MPEGSQPGIRLVGMLCIGLGIILFIFAGLLALFALFGQLSTDLKVTLSGILAFGLSLVVASTLVGCGLNLAEAGQPTGPKPAVIRLNWTALVIIMTLAVAPGAWLSPHLAVLAIFVLALLAVIRNRIRDLTP